MSKRVQCKFFAHGACLKGEYCEFAHDWTAPPSNICTYYQKGACAYGSRCRYDHIKVSRSESYASFSSSSSGPQLIDVAPGYTPEFVTIGALSDPGAPRELSATSKAFIPKSKPAWNQQIEHFDLGGNNDILDSTRVRPADRALCSFAAAGNCPRGEKCPHIHGDLCTTCGKHCLHPFRPKEREEHKISCEKRQKHLISLKNSQEIECSVCLERVLSKPTAAERKFGLLSECDHPFCISCIRNWRSSSPSSGMDVNSALRACPICRKLSYFVIPSVIWYFSKEDKQDIIDNYKSKLQSIDCKYFDFGSGSCPFGASCFYKYPTKVSREHHGSKEQDEKVVRNTPSTLVFPHAYRDGRLEEVVLRHLGASDGDTVIAKDIRLSDFLSGLRIR